MAGQIFKCQRMIMSSGNNDKSYTHRICDGVLDSNGTEKELSIRVDNHCNILTKTVVDSNREVVLPLHMAGETINVGQCLLLVPTLQKGH